MVWIWVIFMGCGASPEWGADPVEEGWLNHPPILHEVWLEPDPGDAHSVWHAGGEGEDPEGEPLTWFYSWRVDGLLVQEGSSPMLLPGQCARGSLIRVEVSVADPWGAWSLPATREREVGNASPGVGVVHLSPTPLTAADEVVCEAIDADSDGDLTIQEVRWYLGGEEVASDGDVLAPGVASRGDLLSCGITSTDGIATSDQRLSDQVLVENALPQVVSATISPSSPSVSDTLTVVDVVLADADLDELSTGISWWSEGVLLGHGVSLEPPLRVNATVSAEIYPFDGWSEGEAYRTEPVRVQD